MKDFWLESGVRIAIIILIFLPILLAMLYKILEHIETKFKDRGGNNDNKSR